MGQLAHPAHRHAGRVVAELVAPALATLPSDERAARVGAMRQAMRDAEADPDRARAEMALMVREEPTITVPQPFIPARFAHATLDDFSKTLSAHQHDEAATSQRVAYTAVLEWRKRAYRGEPAMLALIGPTGIGKSHLLYAAVRSLVTANRRVYTQPWYNLADSIRYGGRSAWDASRTLDANEMRSEVKGEKIICLDDVRPTAGTAFDDTELGKIILDAWDRQAAMLITTNVSPLTDVLSPPLASRFTQVTMVGRDRRRS
jgi:hypothetical protein